MTAMKKLIVLLCAALLLACPEGVEFKFVYGVDGREFTLDTAEIREALVLVRVIREALQ